MIGGSVSICIDNLARGTYGKITVDNVKVIFVDRDYKSTEELVAYCRKYFWEACPDKAEEIFWQLYNAGKIREPKGRKYGSKMLSWPSPAWYDTYEEYRDRQLRHGNGRFIELVEAENLHADLVTTCSPD